MKREFIIHTNGLKVALFGTRLNSNSKGSNDITLWSSGNIVARIPKHSLRVLAKPFISESDGVMVYSYTVEI